MAVERELWREYIAEKIHQKNIFLGMAVNATAQVINGKAVHIPQAGILDEPELNASSFPLTVGERTDTDIVYLLDSLAMKPVRIANIDTYQLSYSKMQSVLGQQTDTLTDRLGTIMLHNWVRPFSYSGSATTSAASRILTTGANTVAHMPTATGNRKKFVANDLKAAKSFLDKQNVPADGRVAVMSPDMYSQLCDDTTLTNYRLQEYNITTGMLPKLYGFEIIVRSKVVGYKSETDLLNLFSYTPDVADCDAVVCYHRDFVEYAEGAIDVFGSENNPEYLGDIYSAEVRFGGRKRYADATGIVCVVQDIP
jgi:hypothetical protein